MVLDIALVALAGTGSAYAGRHGAQSAAYKAAPVVRPTAGPVATSAQRGLLRGGDKLESVPILALSHLPPEERAECFAFLLDAMVSGFEGGRPDCCNKQWNNLVIGVETELAAGPAQWRQSNPAIVYPQ